MKDPDPTEKRAGGISADPQDELKHFYVCKLCGQAVDRRNGRDVLYHKEPGHGPLPSDA